MYKCRSMETDWVAGVELQGFFFIYCMLHHYSDTTCSLTILLYNFLTCIVQLYL